MKRREFIQYLSFALLDFKSVFNHSIYSNKDSKNLQILLNPGHNKAVFKQGYGCYMKGVGYEYIINTKIAEKTQEFLHEQGLNATLTRDEIDYLPSIETYLKHNKEDLLEKISEFRKNNTGNHRMPLEEAVIQLSILKWAESQPIDLIINIHINDTVEEYRGKFSGFSVTTSPENGSFEKSKLLAHSIYDSLIMSFKPSNNKADLVLVKQNNIKKYIPGFMMNDYLMLGHALHRTQIPSVLIECGFIDEKYREDNLAISDERVQNEYAHMISEGIILYNNNSQLKPL
ncbi:MAG: N-acetylmuramoyl-L-alanine amidase [Nanoarchaeota archaeon]|nr:N-acetylmuramoyl-L-alanine amidase [Nanoarchaeota archaeon]MBU1321415.1 N-acetylmuramoyl-L-alanine amidase [Nanoarchaeota archaeon]MBU1597041.1 N-acetylmuramoyl-L-alanine amidase [Nanoarchaeota archaeon]MBU2440831.1 N-acetylmuramoyl-L-alanine amidase [Nanoarchaeota archaeon]